MKTLRVTVQLCLLLCLLPSVASASPVTLTGSMHFSALDGSAQDSDGLANGVFTVSGDLVIDGTIHCNDSSPLPQSSGACPIRISVSGDLTLEAGSGIFAENRRGSGNGGNVRLDVGGDLTLLGPDASLPGAVVSTSRTTGDLGTAGSLIAEVVGAVDLQAGSVLAASSYGGNAGAITVTGETVRVAGLVAAGGSRTVLATRFSGAALNAGNSGQAGGTIHLRALGSAEPGLQIESDGSVVSQGEEGGGRLVLLEACGIEVRGLVASLSKNNGPSQVALRSGKSILVDGRDLGSAAPAEGRFGRIRADGTQQGAAGYLVDLFAQSDIQALGPAPSSAQGLFAVTSRPGDQPLRNAGGTITAISLSGALTAIGNAFETGRDVQGDKGGVVDLQARGDVMLDDATIWAVGGFTSNLNPNARAGGHIDIRSFQGAVSWTFGVGDVRPTGTGVPVARRGTIEITACTTVDTTGTQFPVTGSSVPPFPVENEGVCSPAAPSLPADEPPLPVCAPPNAPPEPSGGPFSVAENSANGTSVGTVSANDPDAGQTHTFSITNGNTDGAFAIGSSSGEITVANSAALNFETTPTFNLTVEATDDGASPLSGTTTVVIDLTDANDAPTDIALSGAAVAEDQPSGTAVGNFTTTDQDAGDTFTYTLVAGAGSGDNGSFQIVGDQLRTAAVFDAETKSSYSVRVRSTDSGGLFFEKVFTITVTNANDAPTDIALSNSTVAEGQPSGTAVGSFSTTDPDPGDTFTYTLVAGVGGDDNGSFQIIGNQLLTNAVLDFETKSSYSIRVRSMDSGGLFFEKVFTITVTNVNEEPTDIVLSNSTTAEGQASGAAVGSFSTTDPDPGDTFTYTLVAGAGSNDNGSFQIVGDQLRTAEVFDFETKSSYSIRVRSTDSGSLFFEKVFTITVTNLNEVPTDIALSNSSVNENQPAGTAVGSFSTTDPDAGDTFTYTLVAGAGSTDNGSFQIVGNQLQTAAVFNYEVKNSYSIRVHSTDSGGLFTEKVFTISINDVPEPPVADNDAFDFIGNTELRVDLDAASTPHALATTPTTFGVLDGDSDPEGGALTVSQITGCGDLSAPYTCATANGGTVTMESNGRFSYTPKEGDTTATDSFQYVVRDPTSLTATGTVVLTRFGRVWYMKNDAAAGGLGRSNDPFDTLAEAQTASSANDYIFVYFGDGTTTNQSSGIALKNGQHLIGEFDGLKITFSPAIIFNGAAGTTSVTLLAKPAADACSGNPCRPFLDDTVAGAPEGVGATDVIPAEIVGLNLAGNVNAIDWSTSAAISGAGTLTIRDNIVRSAGADGVDINLAGTGAVNLAFHNNNLAAAGTGLDIQETGTGSLTIPAFNDNAVSGNTGGTGININSATFDATPGGSFNTVGGGATVIGGAGGNGVGQSGLVLTSVQGSLSFSDLDIFANSGAGLRVSGAGGGMTFGVLPGVGIIEATGGPAVDAASVALSLPLSSIKSTNSPTTGVALNSASGTAFQVGSSNASITYKGTISTTSGKGVDLTGNTGSTISFQGTLNLNTGTNTAFNAAGGGVVTATDTSSTLTTTTATALNIVNTTIGANDLRFRSISSGVAGGSGPVNGINLNNTGTSGGLIVSGNGGVCTFATPTCSGGTIQSSTGDAVRLVSTQNVSLTRLRIHDNDTNGIYGDELTNFTLADSVISDNDVANPSAFEAGVKFNELYGTNSITNTVVRGTKGDNIRLEMASGTLSSLTLTSVTVGPTANVGGGYSNGFSIVTTGTPTLNVTVTTSLFTGLDSSKQQSSGILTSIGGGTTTLTVTDSDFEHENIGIDLGSSSTGIHRFNINNNDVVFHRTNAVNIVGNSVMDGTVNNNRIGNGTVDSGSMNSFGIAASHRGNATWSLALTNNIVRNSDFEGIFVRTGDLLAGDNGTVNLTLTGNTVFAPDDNSGFPANPKGIHLRSRQATTLCMNIANNEAQGAGAAGYHLQESDTSSLRFQDFNTNAVTTLSAKNNKTAGGAPTTNEVGAPFAGACTPTLPSFP
jgi:VCBS repeat-containing protein